MLACNPNTWEAKGGGLLWVQGQFRQDPVTVLPTPNVTCEDFINPPKAETRVNSKAATLPTTRSCELGEAERTLSRILKNKPDWSWTSSMALLSGASQCHPDEGVVLDLAQREMGDIFFRSEKPKS